MAITLLSLLVLLLVGLATLTGVETVSATAAQFRVQAREYARLANDLALAQLQELAGPDQRVTATAGAASGSVHAHWTGVWDSRADGVEPVAWLVSGGENIQPSPFPSAEALPGKFAELVGRSSSGVADDVVAPLEAITVRGVPGAPAGKSTTIGRYAWWIGDQGVKAPVAGLGRRDDFPDRPFNATDPSAYFRQQVSRGAGAVDANGHAIFEVRDAANAALTDAGRLLTFPQIAFLRDTAGLPVGLTRLRDFFHTWAPNNRAVLANTKLGGLRQDLSLMPLLLGEAFAAWMDFGKYLEDPAASTTGVTAGIVPPYGPVPLRRRYRIGPPVAAGGLIFARAPVLSFFFLQFNVRRVGGNSAPTANTALEVRARLVAQLWNPWTSALVPAPLRLEIAGLPDLAVEDSNGGKIGISLQSLFGRPMIVELRPEDTAFPGDPDDVSWLPGRVYAWRSRAGGPGGWKTEFYNRTLSVPNANVWVVPAGVGYAGPASNNVRLAVSGAAAQLEVTLKTIDGDLLSTTRSPAFAAFATTPQRVNANDEYRFGFPMRLVDPIDFATSNKDGGWLTGGGIDPRAPVSGEPLIRAGSGGDLPSAYVGVGGNSVFTDENRLLDRVMGKTGMSYNEDTPVFELPRSSPLSLGQLQHLQLLGARPFGIGNSWGAAARVNGIPLGELFDRFFLSGLGPDIDSVPTDDGLRLPGPLLEMSARYDSGGQAIDSNSLRLAPGGRSSKFLLQSGAFNINSVSIDAWSAVLQSGRVESPPGFVYLNASAAMGTAGDGQLASLPANGAAFFRFAQSAQETAKADPGYAASPAVPPDEPEVASLANTHLYRRGIRTLAADEVMRLARALVDSIQLWHARFGPFRSLEEFLSPQPLFENRSAVERAIAEAGVNSAIAEFSSQWLTQADILTILAPVLFPRSDTFMIRSYGEAANPVTGVAEGRAWCESIVQRMPEYFDALADEATALPADLTSPLNKVHGRRFKVVAFRWLTRSDI